MKSKAYLLLAWLWLIAPILIAITLGNMFAKWRILQIKSNLPRTHDRYTLPKQEIYKRNVRSTEINKFGDLCAIAGYISGKKCPYWAGERKHQFITDEHGFQTVGKFRDSKVVFIGDSFLGGNGGDNTSNQVGNMVSILTRSKVYEAAHPGHIGTYIKRHAYLTELETAKHITSKKYILMLFEGNDFVMPGMERPSQIARKSKSFFDKLIEYTSNTDLYSLMEIIESSRKAKDKSSSNLKERVITANINGKIKAFYRDYYNISQIDLTIPKGEFNYIKQNKNSICAIVFIPTASSVFLLKQGFDRRHPSLSSQFHELTRSGIDVIVLEEELRNAAIKKNNGEQIWWSDDTHWNKNGMLIAAKVIANNTDCVWDGQR